MKQLIRNIKQISILLLVIAFAGCDDEDAVLPKVTAGFTYTVNQDLGVVTFINISENAANYMWVFGDETESTEINPTKIYQVDGTYEVTLKAINVAGATDTFNDMISISIPKPLTLPINFDGNVLYTTAIEGNVSFAVIDNPELSGINAIASKVGQITNVGANWENAFFNLATPVDLSANKTIKMKMYSTQALPIKLKLEDSAAGEVEADVNHGGTGWEELIFTLISDASYSDMVLFVDGLGTAVGTFYVDDIEQVMTIDNVAPVITLTGDAMMTVNEGTAFTDPGATAADNLDGDISANIVVGGDTVDVDTVGTYTITYNVSDAAGNAATEVTRVVEVIGCTDTMLELPIDFDCSGIDYTSKIVGNVSFMVLDNPQLSGVNNVDSKVGQITNVGANWENAFFNLDTAVDFTTDKGIKMKFYSTQALEIKLKFEDGTAAPVENDQNHGGTGWEELTFTITSSDSYNDMILFVDGPGTAAGTFYIDDVEQVAVTTPPPPVACTDTMLELPIDFDCAGTDYVSKDTGDVAFEVIDNPQLSGINATPSKVAKLVFDSNQPWENMNLNLDIPVDFTTDKAVKMKFFSSDARTLKLKFETGGAAVENDQPHTGSGWEEITFTIGSSDSFSNLVLFVDGGSNTIGTFYVDDIEQVASSGGGTAGAYNITLPIDFEASGFGANWAWNVFENDSNQPVEFVANPDASGINTSATVAKITALQAGQPYVGCEIAHGEMGITWDLSASNAIIKIMVYKTVISDVGIKLANPAGGAQGEIKVANTKINEWEELTFNFTDRIGNGLDGSTNIDQVIIFPDFNVNGRTADNVVYFDNIRFTN